MAVKRRISGENSPNYTGGGFTVGSRWASRAILRLRASWTFQQKPAGAVVHAPTNVAFSGSRWTSLCRHVAGETQQASAQRWSVQSSPNCAWAISAGCGVRLPSRRALPRCGWLIGDRG
jgi:hypothetical protein